MGDRKEIKKNIVFVHLLNDFSGSPHMLSHVIKCIDKQSYNITVLTSKTQGFLSDFESINYLWLNYKWQNNKVLLLINFIFTQIQLMLLVFYRSVYRKNEIFYINTILPFGAALAAFLFRRKIIYHIHEYYIKPNLIQRFAIFVMKNTANQIVFVSNYLSNTIKTNTTKIVLYNTLSPDFFRIASTHFENKSYENIAGKSILMISSLKEYKGIMVFLQLAERLKLYKFVLIVGASPKETRSFINANPISENLSLYSMQTNLHPYYRDAAIILNLTLPDKCVETFGLTLLEGMAYGLPVIGPPIGGPAEIIKHCENGFLVNPYDLDELSCKIEYLLSDSSIYKSYSFSSFEQSKKYDFDNFKLRINEFINGI